MTTVMESAFMKAGFAPVKPLKVRPMKEQKCRKCGAAMALIEGTNVMVCTGDIETKDAEGNTKLASCNNKFIFSITR